MNEKFAQRLKDLRKEKKLTQEELAQKINSVKSAISNYENGYRIPDEKTLDELAKIFEVDRAYLKGESDFRSNREIADKIVEQLVKNGILKQNEQLTLEQEKKILSLVQHGISLYKDLNEK